MVQGSLKIAPGDKAPQGEKTRLTMTNDTAPECEKPEWRPFFRDSQDAFNNAIATNGLNTDEKSELYAGHWMYMHTEDGGQDAFKEIISRRYIYIRNDNLIAEQFFKETEV